ncbi:MAG: hypothetical protein JWN86_1593 [Planctomycetota bacterium]|nr:hypothetical protein [Planctomycetota bacterium]
MASSRRQALAQVFMSAMLLIAAIVGTSPAQEQKKEDDRTSWLPILKQHASDYEIVVQSESKTRPKPLSEPILRWTQPVRGGDDGAVFLWVANGRPEVVGTVFTYRVPGSARTLQHEVHSLSLSPLETRWRGKSLWRSAKPGVTFHPVPDAPVPAPSGAARLRQMQEIARNFAGTSVHEKSGKNELRLMPRALYRYEPNGADPTDGALFCLAHGTDPEIFLLLENRLNGWQFALARFSDLELHARYKGREVWTVPHGNMNVLDAIHSYYVVEEVNADTPDEYRAATKTR